MNLKNEDVLSKLKEFSTWNEGKDDNDQITLWDFSTFIATPDILFAIAELFNPEICRFDGCYFIKEKFSEDNYKLWKSKGLDKSGIEKVINHIHMTTILQSEKVDFDLAKNCAELIVFMWNKILKSEGVIGIVLGNELDDLSVTLVQK